MSYNVKFSSLLCSTISTYFNAFFFSIYLGTGGRVGAKGATLSQYVAQQIVSRKPDPFEKDPRAAILRHAKEASENPYWIDPAYKKFVMFFLILFLEFYFKILILKKCW